LEFAEAQACVQFAEARREVFPESGSEWIEHGGAYAVFDGAESPSTQSFGLGLREELSADSLDAFEAFFRERGGPVLHEVSPLVGVAALDLLCARGYRPVEISNVMYRGIEKGAAPGEGGVEVRLIGSEEAGVWADISARGWAQEHPEFMESLRQFGAVIAARPESICFLAGIGGQPSAAGVLSIHEGVALFGGSSTVPEMRRRGLQSALLGARMNFAAEHGCDVAMMVAWAGSDSQRNAERKGFRVAYTRTKWGLRGEIISR
jgi:GNAT superfamily N-acetyltransferase